VKYAALQNTCPLYPLQDRGISNKLFYLCYFPLPNVVRKHNS
jgi:hypothetical protein